MRAHYTYLEVESIENDYDQQVPLAVIAENVNRDYHDNQLIRTAKSVSYVIGKLNKDFNWRLRLESEWLATIK